jgi:hypothetical protein
MLLIQGNHSTIGGFEKRSLRHNRLNLPEIVNLREVYFTAQWSPWASP